MTIRKKSSNIPHGHPMPRAVKGTEGTVDLNGAVNVEAQRKKNKAKGRRHSSKASAGSLWGSCFGF
jgi:hypothetical protein